MDRFERLYNDSEVDKLILAQNTNLTEEQIDLLYTNRRLDKKLLGFIL